MQKVVLVLGDTVTALSTLRALKSLKTEGYQIWLASTHRDENIAYRSNVPDRKIIFSEGLLTGLETLAKGSKVKPILLMTRDDEVTTISRHRDRLAPIYTFLLPEHKLVETLMQKSKFSDFAIEKGLTIPKTVFVHRENDLDYLERELEYPFILKPYLLHAVQIDNIKQLNDMKKDWEPVRYESMIAQEFIQGDDDSLFFCFLLFNQKCQLVHSMFARKLRQWPISYGTTSLAVTLEDERFKKEVQKFVQVLRGPGYYSIEFKYDSDQGHFLIMEPTVGRFNQQVALSVAAGVNFPLAMVRLLSSEAIIEKPQINNILWIYESNDLLSWTQSGRKYGYLRNFVKPHVKALFSHTDPKPFFFEVYSMGRKRIHKIFKHV